MTGAHSESGRPSISPDDPPQLLRKLRRERRLSQEALAAAANLHVRTIRGLETRHITHPRRSSISLLADALQLPATARSHFFSAWLTGGADFSGAAPIFAGADEADDELLLDDLARAHLEAFRPLLMQDQASVQTGHRVAWRRMTDVFEARVPVATRTVFLEPRDPRVDLTRLDLQMVRGGEVVRTAVSRRRGIKAFVLRLASPLGAGEVATLTHTVDFDAARDTEVVPPTDVPPTLGRGFFVPPTLYTLSVRFECPIVRSSVSQCYVPRPYDEPEIVRPARLSDEGCAELVIEHPRPGGHGISWCWPGSR